MPTHCRPALETVKSIQLYVRSLERYGKSPYIYPMYGLGGLPEGFSRLCAIHGGTFMLQCPVEEVLFDDQGVAWGIKATMDGVPQARKCCPEKNQRGRGGGAGVTTFTLNIFRTEGSTVVHGHDSVD